VPKAFWRTALPLLVALAALAACSDSSVTQQSPEERVAERSVARWDAMIAGDWKKAYDMLTPGYREATPFDRWRAQFGSAATWKSVSVEDIICTEGDRCQATLLLDYEVSIPRFGVQNRPGRRPIEETWLLVDGEWWHFPQR
jgi:hypothetical protein